MSRFSGSYPRRAECTEEWLSALSLGRYHSSLADIPVHALSELTDEKLQALGVSFVGHRKRILVAATHLTTIELLPPGCCQTGAISTVSTSKPADNEASSESGSESRTGLDEMFNRLRTSPRIHTVEAGRLEGFRFWGTKAVEGLSESVLSVTKHVVKEEDEVEESRRPVADRMGGVLKKRVASRSMMLVVTCVAVICLPRRTWTYVPKLLSLLFIVAGSVSMWPTDAHLRGGWGKIFTLAVSGSGVLSVAADILGTWPLTIKYRLPAQRVLHQALLTTILVWFLTNFFVALRGRSTWAQHRLGMALTGCSPLICLGILHTLQNGLSFQHPTHDCFLSACVHAADSLATVWVQAWIDALCMLLVSGWASPENRRRVASLTGLAHIRLNLGDIRS